MAWLSKEKDYKAKIEKVDNERLDYKAMCDKL